MSSGGSRPGLLEWVRRTYRRLPWWWRTVRISLSGRRTAIQLAAVIVGALCAAITAVMYSAASGTWQQAIREETVRSGTTQEQVRAVYGDEAPTAFRIATARARAQALLAVDGESRLIASEQVVAEQSAFALGQSAPPATLAAGREYALPGGGFDVSRRLADLARSRPRTPDPDRTAVEGDDRATLAARLSLLTVVVTGVAVVAASIPSRSRRARRERDDADDGADRVGVGEAGSDETDIIPQPGAADRRRRRTSFVLLALWAAGVLLPFAQLALGGEEQRSQAVAARAAVRLSGQVAVSLARSGFETNALRDAAFADIAATAREIGALDAGEADAAIERAVARAEGSAASSTRDVAVQMGRAPTTAEGLDAYTVTALASGPADWTAALQAQTEEEEADRADRFGAWANGIVALIAVAAALSALVEVASAGRRKCRC